MAADGRGYEYIGTCMYACMHTHVDAMRRYINRSAGAGEGGGGWDLRARITVNVILQTQYRALTHA
jgi:hypothetical protein